MQTPEKSLLAVVAVTVMTVTLIAYLGVIIAWAENYRKNK